MEADTKVGQVDQSGEWSEEEGEKFEDASEGMLTSPPRTRVEQQQTAVFDVEVSAVVKETKEDVDMQDGSVNGNGEEERKREEAEESSPRRARFTEEFNE